MTCIIDKYNLEIYLKLIAKTSTSLTTPSGDYDHAYIINLLIAITHLYLHKFICVY